MISAEEPVRQSRDQLLGTGLPLQEPMPLQLATPAGTSPDRVGPLALDYRTWETKPLQMSVEDVTFTLSSTRVSYDGRSYIQIYNDKVDDK